jgi:hypothetical protein
LCIIDLTSTNYWQQIQIGIEDYIYKAEHGYNSFSLGFEEGSDMKKRINKTFWLDYWKEHYR